MTVAYVDSIFRGFDNKLRDRNIVNISSTALGTSSKPQDTKEIANYGMHLHALRISVTVDVSGTLSAQENVMRVLEKIKLNDKNGNSIWDEKIKGDDLPLFRRWLDGRGIDRTPPNVSNSSQTYTLHVPCHLRKELFPVTLDLSLAAYDDLATGASAGNAAVVIDGIFAKNVDYPVSWRFHRYDMDLASGSNDIPSKFTAENLAVVGTFARFGTPGNFSKFTFNEDGQWEVVERSEADLQAMEEDFQGEGSPHVTGEYNFFLTPYEITNAMEFEVVTTGTTTMNLLLVSQDRAPSKA